MLIFWEFFSIPPYRSSLLGGLLENTQRPSRSDVFAGRLTAAYVCGGIHTRTSLMNSSLFHQYSSSSRLFWYRFCDGR